MHAIVWLRWLPESRSLPADADTVHMPQSVERGVTQAFALDTALLSAFPYQRTKTWSKASSSPLSSISFH